MRIETNGGPDSVIEAWPGHGGGDLMNGQEWARTSPVIDQLNRWCETKRQEVVKHVLSRLRGKLSDADCAATENALSRLQDQFLRGPIRTLSEESHTGGATGYTLVEALLRLFRLPDLGSGLGLVSVEGGASPTAGNDKIGGSDKMYEKMSTDKMGEKMRDNMDDKM